MPPPRDGLARRARPLLSSEPGGPPFLPTRSLRGGHAMTIAGAVVDRWRAPRLSAPRHRLFDTAPGTRVLGLWHPPPRPKGPVAVVLHGLTGDANAGYVQGVSDQLARRGLGALRLNMRNRGGTERLTDTLYHAGLTTDVKAVVRALVQEGHKDVVLIGFSMGGNIALKAAGEWGTDAPEALRAVVAISPPIRLWEASAAIERPGLNAIYQRSFLDGLVALLERKATVAPHKFDAAGARKVRTIREFDHRYIAPGFGFAGAEDYYARASADAVLDRLARPALVVQARDDSIVPPYAALHWAARAPAHFRLELHDTGGHQGFVQRRVAARLAGSRFWAEARAADFARDHVTLSC